MISDNNNISIYKQDSIAGRHAVLGDKIMILRAVNNDCTLIFYISEEEVSSCDSDTVSESETVWAGSI